MLRGFLSDNFKESWDAAKKVKKVRKKRDR
jgi:hypothetical protein